MQCQNKLSEPSDDLSLAALLGQCSEQNVFVIPIGAKFSDSRHSDEPAVLTRAITMTL
jgi:hypothetical protein